MERITTTIPQAEVDRQLQYCREIARMNADRGEAPLAFVDTYGCQQNEADSERIRGYLRQMGYVTMASDTSTPTSESGRYGDVGMSNVPTSGAIPPRRSYRRTR